MKVWQTSMIRTRVDAKKKWIQAWLTGMAATAFRRLIRQRSQKLLLGSQRDSNRSAGRSWLYIAEFQRRSKRKNEEWALYAEDIKTLLENENAYPALQAEALELLALNNFLAQIDNP